jgi:hypothetical protein
MLLVYVQSLLIQKIFIGDSNKPTLDKNIFVGRKRNMSEFIWHWTKENIKIYTRNIEIAEKALKEGLLIMGEKAKPSNIEY